MRQTGLLRSTSLLLYLRVMEMTPDMNVIVASIVLGLAVCLLVFCWNAILVTKQVRTERQNIKKLAPRSYFVRTAAKMAPSNGGQMMRLRRSTAEVLAGSVGKTCRCQMVQSALTV